MFPSFSPHTRAVLQAFLVTFLWATSWVLIKWGLEDIPALTFAGLRYTLALLFLIPVAVRSGHLSAVTRLSKTNWLQLIALGVVLYTVTQGAQFLSLFYLSAITTNLLLSFSSVVVAFLSIALLGEKPSRLQWAGVILYLAGVWVYFYPAALPMHERIGLIIAVTGVLANSVSSVLGRAVNRGGQLPPIAVTVVSMGIGALILLILGIAVQGLPPLTLRHWLVILWLAAINTAFAFTLWNHTLRTLSAVESTLLNSLMLIQIPLLAYFFLGETLQPRALIGHIAAGVGIFMGQWAGRQ